MVEVLVEYDYDAEQPDELTIKVGNIIKNVVMSEGGWWEGEMDGKKGMFPDNFVKVIEKNKPKEEPKKEIKISTNQRASVRELANKLKDGVPIGSAISSKKKDSNNSSIKHKKAKVLFDYEPENDDELKIDEGDIVEIYKQEEEGWWEGCLNGKVGVFPSNFVEIIEEKEPEKPEKAQEEDKPKDPEIKGKKIMGVGLGNIFEGGPIKLRSTLGTKSAPDKEHKITDESPVVPLPSVPVMSSPVVKREKPAGGERAVVRYSYTAQNDDELSLSENDIVMVLEKDVEDVGWWRGEINGKRGVFPDNFVELLPPDDHSGKHSRPASTVLSKIPPQPKPKKPPPPSVATTPKSVAHVVKPQEKIPDPVSKPERPVLPEATHPDKHSHTDKMAYSKKKEHHIESEKHTPPVLPGKKPVLPPPVGKKPTKPDPPRPVSMHEKPKEDHQSDNKIMSQSMMDDLLSSHTQASEKKTESGFEGVEPSTEKLRHLTANRAKGPSKRPPSQVMFTNTKGQRIIKDEERNGDVKESHWLKEEKDKHSKKLPSPPLVQVKEEVPKEKPSAIPTRPPEPSITAAVFHSTIEELRKEIQDLKASSVSKAKYDELKSDHEKLKKEVETLRSTYQKKIRDLVNEVDDEKKIRLSTQVEIERIRKLVNESHV